MIYDPDLRRDDVSTTPLGLGDALDASIGEELYELTVVGIDANGVVLARTAYGHVMPVYGVTFRAPLVKIPRRPRNRIHASRMSPGHSDGRFGEQERCEVLALAAR